MPGKTPTLIMALSAATLISALGASTSAIASNGFDDERLTKRTHGEVTSRIKQLQLSSPVSTQADPHTILNRKIPSDIGKQRVIVRLKSKSVSRHFDQSWSGRNSHKAKIKNDQDRFMSRVSKMAPESKSMARVQLLINAVFMDVDASKIDEISKDQDVYSVHRVRDYQMDLSETVPYIGAQLAQDSGFDGTNIKVAVLDSGIDYTHAAFGGGGTLADYEAAWGTFIGDPTQTSRDGLFPTSKVVDGYDFVGEDWPNSPEAPDDDPIDFQGHGTHVADIIGGLAGVAPGVDLYAVKVCSAVSSSCSGMALIQGMEYAVDPNGDGDPSDAVDIINMSLGSNYGQPFDDDLAAAVDNASSLGVLTVASAGNGGNKPYVNGTPAAAATALSVAQTQVPSASLPFLTVDGDDFAAAFQSWSVKPTGIVAGIIQYGDGAGRNLNGCAAFTNDLTGLAVLVNRGSCNFTLKIKNINDAGGVIGIIGLVDGSDPFSGGDGGDRPITIPGYMVSLATANAFRDQAGSELVVDPANGLDLIGQMVGSSSRGPQHDATTLIKPEIGAPGASVSAIAGTGTGSGVFGGTSGAAPMVSGSAAILLQSAPNLKPAEIKARLINTGDTDIQTDPNTGLAPISRIGGGEVRVDKALSNQVAAWDAKTLQGALSFGFVDVDKNVVNLQKIVKIRNYSNKTRNFSVTPTFRYEDDALRGAVSVHVPSGKVMVKAGNTATVVVEMRIIGALLTGNAMNSGSSGADPDSLTFNEYDGYLVFDDGINPIKMPWHVLPRKAANVKSRTRLNIKKGVDEISLKNTGVGTAQLDAFSLIALSDNQSSGGLGEQSPTPDIRAVGVSTIPVPAGFCSANDSFVWVFAINSWERQQHLLPVSYQVVLDTNQDGAPDYVVLNRDLSGPTTITDGRQLTWVLDVATGTLGAFFFAEHATNTGNTMLTICGEQIGMNASNFLNTPVNTDVFADDFYFGGPGDAVTGLTITPLGERYLGTTEGDIPAQSKGILNVQDFGELPGNSPELGLMLITNGDRGPENRGGATQKSEAILIKTK